MDGIDFEMYHYKKVGNLDFSVLPETIFFLEVLEGQKLLLCFLISSSGMCNALDRRHGGCDLPSG